jgi:hypothetical protein
MTWREDIRMEGDPIRMTTGLGFYSVDSRQGGEKKIEVEDHR